MISIIKFNFGCFQITFHLTLAPSIQLTVELAIFFSMFSMFVLNITVFLPSFDNLICKLTLLLSLRYLFEYRLFVFLQFGQSVFHYLFLFIIKLIKVLNLPLLIFVLAQVSPWICWILKFYFWCVFCLVFGCRYCQSHSDATLFGSYSYKALKCP
jgi:hypothetical protein